MEKRDYLLDQIEQMGKVIATLLTGFLGLKSQGKVSLAIEVTTQQMKEELDVDTELIMSLSEKDLKSYFEERKVMQHHLDKLAIYFLEVGEALYGDDRPTEARDYLLKANQLLGLSADFTKMLSLEQMNTKQRINKLMDQDIS